MPGRQSKSCALAICASPMRKRTRSKLFSPRQWREGNGNYAKTIQTGPLEAPLNQNENTVNKGKWCVNTSKWFVVIFCLALFCALALPSTVMADEENQAIKLTFSDPVEVPGQVLPVGTYWSPSRTTIQIAIWFRSGTRTARNW